MPQSSIIYSAFCSAEATQEKQQLIDSQPLERLKSLALHVYIKVHDEKARTEVFPYLVRSFILHHLDSIGLVENINFAELIGENEWSVSKIKKSAKKLVGEIQTESKSKNLPLREAFESICGKERVVRLLEQIAHIFIHAEKQKISKKKSFPTNIQRDFHRNKMANGGQK